ncbi:MAG: anaerobic ribonucleoside-triphosphate reductase activating protein [Candidatus Thiodiazotropha sp.]
MAASALRVGGLEPMTTVDFPDRLAAVVFCQGCPMRCRYCHNPELLPRQGEIEIPWPDILAFLESRRSLLDAVVFSGGEPTQQRALPDAIQAVREMGFEIGLHTAGVYPKRLARLLPSIDWVGLDVKALPEAYPALTGMPGSGALAWESVRLVAASGVPYQLRTTVHPELMSRQQQARLQQHLDGLRPLEHIWQACRTDLCADLALVSQQGAL